MQYLDISDRPDNLIICGDIHGEFKTLVYNIEQKQISDATVIVAGDCGFGFEKDAYYECLYNHLHPKLERLNVLLLMVRGNHDDPRYFSEEMIDFPFMKTLPDYTVVHTMSYNVLCIGGAVSVDRHLRLSQMDDDRNLGKNPNPLYWPGEPVVYDEAQLNLLEQEQVWIDRVVTHTAPAFCPPQGKESIERWCAADENLADDISRERKAMTRIYDYLINHKHPLHTWYYGHFHDSASHLQDGVLFRLLDVMEFLGV